MGQIIKTVSKDEFKEKLDSGEYILIDVRSQEEHDENRIAESIVLNINLEDFFEKLEKLDKQNKYLIYCRSGIRSAKALSIIENEGFKEVYDLEGGVINY